MSDGGYRFLDCGNGRRLEEAGGVLVSRPAPAAPWEPGLDSGLWERAALRFDKGEGWTGTAAADWRCAIGPVVMSLRPAGGGQIGVFPEHAGVAERLAGLLDGMYPGAPCRVLNLFAHTGLATLRLCLRPRTEITHVDAAAAAVKAARENAAAMGVEGVRWLVEDAGKYVKREVKRGKQYDAVLLDPPSFGRGGKGEWRFERDFPGLLADVSCLLTAGGILCATCHSTEWPLARVMGEVQVVFRGWEMDGEELRLRSACGGRDLPAGVAAYAWKRR